MKIAFITTVFNEESSIKFLLESLYVQTKKPDEIIIVDAMSTDGTLEVINSYKKKFGKTSLYVFQKKGNRSVGRNYAIKKSKSEIIVASDAGCTLSKNWLKTIVTPFEDKKIDVVAGFYIAKTRNTFEKSLSTYTCVMKDKVDKDFLPSSRSIAFRKNSWEKVKGYPESLNTCEDLVFAKRMKKVGLHFLVVKSAVVFWPQRKNLIQATRQFYSYAKGDGEGLYIRRNTPLLYIRYLLGTLLLFLAISTKNLNIAFFIGILFSLYLLWAILKNYKYVRRLSALIFLPVLQLVSDVAVLSGMTVGVVKRIYNNSLKLP